MKKLLLLLLVVLFPVLIQAQGIYNNNARIVSATGNYLVISNGSFTVTSTGVTYPATLNNLTINSGTSLKIAAGSCLTVNGSLTNSAGTTGLVIESTTDGTGSLILNNSPDATVERYLTGLVTLEPLVENWHAVSSPVAAQGINGFLTAQGIDHWDNSGVTRYGFAPYLESTNHWDYYSGSTSGNLNPGQGYEVLIGTPTGKVNFIGALNYAAVSADVTRTVGGSTGWNLIGNPYSCSLDVAKFITANSDPAMKFETLFPALYLWNAETKSYDITTTGTLPPGQGFFVRVATGVTSVNITRDMQTHTVTAFKSGQTSWSGIKLIATASGKKSSTEIRYRPGMSLGIDEGNDIGVFNGQKAEFELFTRLIEGSNVDIGLQSLPDNDYENLVVPVGLVAKAGLQVTFKAESSDFPANYRVYLEDRASKRFIRLDEAGSFYAITLTSSSTGPGRFYLHTKPGTTGTGETITDDLTIIALAEQQLIRVLGTVDLPAQAAVYDLNGRMITTVSLNRSYENDIPLKRVAGGIYLLQIRSGNVNINRKINWTW